MQLALGLALAIVNYQHWDAYRNFAASLPHDRRTWINAEWGLRYYLESDGGLPLPKNPPLRAGDVVVSSELAYPLPVNLPMAPLARAEIRPSIPVRIISLDGRSAYSVASARGLLPFEISSGPIDRVRADMVVQRKPELSWIDPKDPHAAAQIVSGILSRMAGCRIRRAWCCYRSGRPVCGCAGREHLHFLDVAPRAADYIVGGWTGGRR